MMETLGGDLSRGGEKNVFLGAFPKMWEIRQEVVRHVVLTQC